MTSKTKSEISVPRHHKEIARHLADRFQGHAKVLIYRDNDDKCPVPVGHFGPFGRRFFSTIGISDRRFRIPAGRFEFAAAGKLPWLPNAIVGSVYWLRDRQEKEWPLVCEDVIRHNAKSTYRHMAYVPAKYSYASSKGRVRWLLGVPLTDTEIGCGFKCVWDKALRIYPMWLIGQWCSR